MRGQRESRERRSQAIRPLLLAAAALWLLLTVLVIAGIQPAAAASRRASSLAGARTSSSSTPGTTPTAMETPTQAVATATDTPVPADTPMDTPAPADTPTDTPTTAPAAGGGGGSNSTNNGGAGSGGGDTSSAAAPNVTRVVFSQPTVAAGNDSAVPALAGATFGSNALLLATTMSCVVGLLGLTVAGVALMVLVRRGYGPFLRALLRGKRAGNARDKQRKGERYGIEDVPAAPPRASSRHGGFDRGSGGSRGTTHGGFDGGNVGAARPGGARRPTATRSRSGSGWR